MKLTTDAINERGNFDPRYTCDIDNSSPELRWQEVPEGTASFALIAEDLDRAFCHWVVTNIPATVLHLPAGIPPQDQLPNGIRQGVNGFGKLGYAGPCPPRGAPAHRYLFRLFALRALPEFPHRATREQVLSLIEAITIETASVLGLYQRALEKTG